MADVKTMRIDDETMGKFKEITAKMGGNQQQTLAKLIDVYELQTCKNSAPASVASRIEDLNGYLTGITRTYMDMVENLTTCKKIIADEFSAQLKSKDITIADLQEKIEMLQTQAEKREKDAAVTLQEKDTIVAGVREQLGYAQSEIIRLQKELVTQTERFVEIQAELLQQKQEQIVQAQMNPNIQAE